jgi:SAM-dependent methyltransferase
MSWIVDATRKLFGSGEVGKPVRLSGPGKPLSLVRGSATLLPVTVSNRGRSTIDPQGSLVLRWRSIDGGLLDVPESRHSLSQPLRPGRVTTESMSITAPFMGHFQVELTFEDTGGASQSEPLYINAIAEAPANENLDYYQVFAAADLSHDYWTAVGSADKDLFSSVAERKLEIMRGVGLTPESRVLDLGCGTGQVTAPLEGFLAPGGSYYGVDIAPEAIAFCKERFKRPNFHFAQSGMTSVPIVGLEFDCIILFSVFTHTYVDETRLLLTETKRLLAGSGVILTDIFHSPFVRQGMGNRGAFEWERDYFVQLAREAGLAAGTASISDWNRYVRREVFKLTHAH